MRRPKWPPYYLYPLRRQSGAQLCDCACLITKPAMAGHWSGQVLSLLPNDLGVLDHGNSATFCDLPLNGDRLAGIFGKLIVHWLMVADDQICFAFAGNADGSALLDALAGAGGVFIAACVVIDIAHQVDDLTSDGFAGRCVQAVLAVLMLLG